MAWLFTYDPLMFKPEFEYLEKIRATLPDYHRTLFYQSTLHWGSQATPGVQLALAKEGSCDGIAYLIKEDELNKILDLIFLEPKQQLDLINTTILIDGNVAGAYALIEKSNDNFLKDLDTKAIVSLITSGRGQRGSCISYLLKCRRIFDSMGIQDKEFQDIISLIQPTLPEAETEASPPVRNGAGVKFDSRGLGTISQKINLDDREIFRIDSIPRKPSSVEAPDSHVPPPLRKERQTMTPPETQDQPADANEPISLSTEDLFEAETVVRKLKDVQNEKDTRNIDVDKVGVKNLRYPVIVMDKNNQWQHTVAGISMFVSLPAHFKGTHMSRFVEVLNNHRGKMTMHNMPMILREIKKRLEAKMAHMGIDFPYFIEKRAPVTQVPGLMEYNCKFTCESNKQERFVLEIQVPVMSVCPCSLEISEKGAHNQRCIVTLQITYKQFVWIEDLVTLVEAAASSPVYSNLKREDEKYVTDMAHDNPKFVEDIVRDITVELEKDENITWFSVSSEHFESIHNHSAYASIERDKR